MCLIICPECAGTVSDKAISCPHCGYPLQHTCGVTFDEVYEGFYRFRFDAGRPSSRSARAAAASAYHNCASLHGRIFCSLTAGDLQGAVDACTYGHSTLLNIVKLFHGMYSYAAQEGITDKDYSRYVRVYSPDDTEHGVPFTANELKTLCEHPSDAGFVLMMCYTGFRISAYCDITWDPQARTLTGGVKTAAGKNRTVPVPAFAVPYIEQYFSKRIVHSEALRLRFYKCLESLGLTTAPTGEKRTPHDCRHTYSWLCDRCGIDEVTKHILMGHSLGSDVERAVYAHRTLDDLRRATDKLLPPEAL